MCDFMMVGIKMLFKRQQAASGTEAGLLIGLIAVAIIGAVGATGDRLNEIFGFSGNMLGAASVGNNIIGTAPTEPEALPASCLEAYQNGQTTSGVYQIDLTGDDEDDAFDVYCDMIRKGGGWTLVGVLADDGNAYWTWNNRVVTYNGSSVYGSVSSITTDFQSQAWHDLPASEVLFTKADSATDFLYYADILSGGTLGDRYPEGTNTTVGEFTASDFVGTWWQSSCSSNYEMSLVHADTDGNAWGEASWGFVWRSVNNHACNYDDTLGGMTSSAYPTIERGWTHSEQFYGQNFLGSALQVWVR